MILTENAKNSSLQFSMTLGEEHALVTSHGKRRLRIGISSLMTGRPKVYMHASASADDGRGVRDGGTGGLPGEVLRKTTLSCPFPGSHMSRSLDSQYPLNNPYSSPLYNAL